MNADNAIKIIEIIKPIGKPVYDEAVGTLLAHYRLVALQLGNHNAERDALKAQSAELVEALEAVIEVANHLYANIPDRYDPYADGYPEWVIAKARAAIKAANG